jgi:hypothetical protein
MDIPWQSRPAADSEPIYGDRGEHGAVVVMKVQGLGYIVIATPDESADTAPVYFSIITDSEATYGF